MATIKTLIADDEKPARRRLQDLLEKEPDIQIAGVARDGRETVELIRATRPDLLFLDIQMPNLDGLGVLAQIGAEAAPVTIFVTAYDKYAIRAFEAHALDYLLKPFSDERFESALERARRHIATRRAGEIGKQIAVMLDDFAGGLALEARQTAGPLERLVIKSGGRVTFLDAAEVDWIEAAGVYVNLHVGTKSLLYRATIGQLLDRLNPKSFVRIHRSAAVNTAFIKEMYPRSHGDYTVVLKDGTELTLSRKYRAGLESWLGQPL